MGVIVCEGVYVLCVVVGMGACVLCVVVECASCSQKNEFKDNRQKYEIIRKPKRLSSGV